MEHLEGIVVLNEYMTYETPWFVILFAVLTLTFFIAAIISTHQNNNWIIAVFTLCCLVFMVLFVIGGVSGVWDVEAGMIYECTITNDITYKELTETYEVIGQRGDIYKLKFIE